MKQDCKRTPNGRFGPGNVANPKGRPRDGESWIGMMRAMGERTGKTGKSLKQEVMEMLYQKATQGDLRAAEMLLDRIEGKATQRVEQDITTDGESLNANISFKKAKVIDVTPEKGRLDQGTA